MLQITRGVILAFVITAVAAIFVLPCRAQKPGEEKKQQDIWSEGEQKGRGMGGPPEFAPPPEGEQKGPRRGPPRFELTDEEIDWIMKGLKERDPAKAKELAQLRGKDPEQFNAKLREYAGEELGKIMRARMETWRAKMQAEFIEWLEKNYAREAKKLANLKDKPELYWKEFDRLREKYWRIFEEERRNPELAEVLKEDLELRERENALARRIKAAKTEQEKKELTAELEDVASRRFDLIVRRKQIAYERLLKWLEEMQKRVKESRAEINKMKDEQIKAENVQKHLKDLLEGSPKFEWD